MKAVVFAAGEGTRLRTLTRERPKPLVPLLGRPLVTHAMDAVRALQPDGFVLVVGHRRREVERVLGDAYRGVPIRYVHQERPEGLARALLVAAPVLDGSFAAVNGDNVFGCSLVPALERHRERGPDATLLVEPVDPGRARQGVCWVDEDGRGGGRIRRVVEHPTEEQRRQGTIAGGFYVLEPVVLEACRRVEPSEDDEYELTDALQLVLDQGGRVEAVFLDGWRTNVNTPDDLAEARERLRTPG